MVYNHQFTPKVRPKKIGTVNLRLKVHAAKESKDKKIKYLKPGDHVTISNGDSITFQDEIKWQSDTWTIEDFRDLTEGFVPFENIDTDYFRWEVEE